MNREQMAASNEPHQSSTAAMPRADETRSAFPEVHVITSTFHLSQVALRELQRRLRLEHEFSQENLLVEMGPYGAFDVYIGSSKVSLCRASKDVLYPNIADIVQRIRNFAQQLQQLQQQRRRHPRQSVICQREQRGQSLQQRPQPEEEDDSDATDSSTYSSDDEDSLSNHFTVSSQDVGSDRADIGQCDISPDASGVPATDDGSLVASGGGSAWGTDGLDI